MKFINTEYYSWSELTSFSSLPFSGGSVPSVGLSRLMKFTATTDDKGVAVTTADIREPQHKQQQVCIDVRFITNTIHITKNNVYLLFLQCQGLNPSPLKP